MYDLLFIFWEIIAFYLFFYSISKTDFRGVLMLLSMALFFGLAFASFNIETIHVFYDETTATVVEHTVHVYSEENAYLSAGMGIIAMVLGFVKAFYLKNRRFEDDE